MAAGRSTRRPGMDMWPDACTYGPGEGRLKHPRVQVPQHEKMAATASCCGVELDLSSIEYPRFLQGDTSDVQFGMLRAGRVLPCGRTLAMLPTLPYRCPGPCTLLQCPQMCSVHVLTPPYTHACARTCARTRTRMRTRTYVLVSFSKQ